MAKRRRVSLRELERRLVRAMNARGSVWDVDQMVHRMRRYAVLRSFCGFVTIEQVQRSKTAQALPQLDIEAAIRHAARKGMER